MDLTATGTNDNAAGRRWRFAGLVGALGILIATAVARTALLPWDALAPDDARYLFVGLSVLDGRGAVTPTGVAYLLRSPVFGVALALGGHVPGWGVIIGAHLVAAALGVAALLGAAALAWRLGGPVAALATGVALVATPLPWELLPTLRIDQALAAMVVVLVLVASTPRPGVRRAAAAGAILGLAILVKEEALPLVILPIAWAVRGWSRPWWVRATVFVLAAVVVAAWWWVYVWVQGSVLFPFNGIAVIEDRQFDAGARLGRVEIAEAGIALCAWLAVAAWARREPILRVLVIAAAGLSVPAAYAVARGLAARNYLPLAMLSAVAFGLVADRALAWVRARWPALGRPVRLGFLAAVVVGVGGGALAGQVTASRPTRADLGALVADELRSATAPGEAIVMTFMGRETVSLELYGRNPVVAIGVDRVEASDDPATYVWLGLRDQQVFGLTRAAWREAAGGSNVTKLVVTVPHALSPAELLPSLEASTPGDSPGTTLEGVISTGDSAAHVLKVDPSAVRVGASSLTLRLTASAAVRWLSYGGGDALARLASATALVVPDASVDDLRAALGVAACLQPAGVGYPAGWLRLLPAGGAC